MSTQEAESELVERLRIYHGIVEGWPSRGDKHSLELDAVAWCLDQAADRITRLAAMQERIERLEAAGCELAVALHGSVIAGCPVCNGDCASANPPVVGCPIQRSNEAVRNWNAARISDEAVAWAERQAALGGSEGQ